MTDGVRVFVNERPVTVAPGARIVDAVSAFDVELAAKLQSGAAYATDGVGRPAEAGTLLVPGAIIRVVVSARRGESSEASE